MRYLIMGAGTLGSVLGGLLQNSGQKVAFLGRAEHFERLQTRGLRIDGIWGKSRVESIVAAASGELYDVILLCVKSFDTLEACQQVKEMLAPNGLIVSMQNGLGNLEIIAREFGSERTIGARVIFGAQIKKPGYVTVSVYTDKVLLGAMDLNGRPPQLPQVVEDLNQAGIPAALVENIWPHIWEKVLYNCALNPLGAILGVPYGELGQNRHSREMMRGIITEIYQVAQAQQVPMLHADAEAYFPFLIEELIPATSAHWPSMWQDLTSGSRTEIEALNGAICRYGADLDVPTPYNQACRRLVRFLEDKNLGQSQGLSSRRELKSKGTELAEMKAAGEFKSGVSCPRCEKGKIKRGRRKNWMRKLPQSKYYFCSSCKTRFLTVYGWKFRLLGKAKAKE